MFATVMPTVSTAITATGGGAEARGRPSRAGAAINRPASRMTLRMAGHLCCGSHARAEALDQVIADAQRIRGDGQRRIHGSARTEEAAIDDVEVVEVVGA